MVSISAFAAVPHLLFSVKKIRDKKQKKQNKNMIVVFFFLRAA